MMKKLSITIISILTLLTIINVAQAGALLEAVKQRDFIKCGIHSGLLGFSFRNENDQWEGIDVDMCRAVAAAVLGNADQVRYIPLTAKERLLALQSGEIDLLSRNTTWTLTRDTALGIRFAGINYYDGQGFMVRKASGITRVAELEGATICVNANTTSFLNLRDYFQKNNQKYTPIISGSAHQSISKFEAGKCQVLTSDQSQLYSLRLKLAKPDSVIILPDVISKEPLGPVVREGDDEWFSIVKWSLFVMLNAEEMEVTSQNVDEMKEISTNPEIRRLLGVGDHLGRGLGLSEHWAYNIIKQVGNYAQVFARNVGEDSPLKIKRGLNALWNQGGIQYAPPIR